MKQFRGAGLIGGRALRLVKSRDPLSSVLCTHSLVGLDECASDPK